MLDFMRSLMTAGDRAFSPFICVQENMISCRWIVILVGLITELVYFGQHLPLCELIFLNPWNIC